MAAASPTARTIPTTTTRIEHPVGGGHSQLLLLRLHDCVSLGQPEVGLVAQQQQQSQDDVDEEARIRLPCLLRLLTLSQPRTAVPDVFAAQQQQQQVHNNPEEVDADDDDPSNDDDSTYDAVLEEAVQRLQERAVQYREADDCQIVSSHLVPTLARPGLARLAPLHKTTRKGALSSRVTGGYYDTTALAEFVTQQQQQQSNTATTSSHNNKPNSSSSKSSKKRRISTGVLVGTHANDGDNHGDPTLGEATTTAAAAAAEQDQEDEEDKMMDDDDEEEEKVLDRASQPPQHERRKTSKFETALRRAAAEDAPEFIVNKTMLELTRLTLESLQQQEEFREDSGSAAAEDSVWATSSSTVASIMPFAPVLRHRHVAVSDTVGWVSCWLSMFALG